MWASPHVTQLHENVALMTDPIPVVGAADRALDQRLSDELDAYNAAATPEVEPAQELTVRIEEGGELPSQRPRLGTSHGL